MSAPRMHRIMLLGESETEWGTRTEPPAHGFDVQAATIEVRNSERHEAMAQVFGAVRVRWSLYMAMPSVANLREHWRAKSARVTNQRDAAEQHAKLAVRSYGYKPFSVAPVSIMITRVGPKKLDGDNLSSCCKAVRDGIALALGIDDGDERTEWLYGQEKGKVQGVRVSVIGYHRSSLESERLRKRNAERVRMLAVKALLRAATATKKRSAKPSKRGAVGK